MRYNYSLFWVPQAIFNIHFSKQPRMLEFVKLKIVRERYYFYFMLFVVSLSSAYQEAFFALKFHHQGKKSYTHLQTLTKNYCQALNKKNWKIWTNLLVFWGCVLSWSMIFRLCASMIVGSFSSRAWFSNWYYWRRIWLELAEES